jgi:hypothetical protein
MSMEVAHTPSPEFRDCRAFSKLMMELMMDAADFVTRIQRFRPWRGKGGPIIKGY